jgi:hypothetical protein
VIKIRKNVVGFGIIFIVVGIILFFYASNSTFWLEGWNTSETVPNDKAWILNIPGVEYGMKVHSEYTASDMVSFRIFDEYNYNQFELLAFEGKLAVYDYIHSSKGESGSYTFSAPKDDTYYVVFSGDYDVNVTVKILTERVWITQSLMIASAFFIPFGVISTIFGLKGPKDDTSQNFPHARAKYTPTFSGEIPIDEKVLRGIEVGRRGLASRLGLYFTGNRVIVARTGVSNLWLIPIVVCALISLLFILGVILLFIYPYLVSLLLEAFPPELSTVGSVMFDTFAGRVVFLTIGIMLLISPRLLITRAMRKKFENVSRLAPNDILMADKKNFEIPYPEIARIEIKKAWGRGAFGSSKIRILTNEKKHEFWFVRLVGFLGYEGAYERLKLKEYEDFIRSILPNKTYVS